MLVTSLQNLHIIYPDAHTNISSWEFDFDELTTIVPDFKVLTINKVDRNMPRLSCSERCGQWNLLSLHLSIVFILHHIFLVHVVKWRSKISRSSIAIGLKT
jgi:hypothetical protein